LVIDVIEIGQGLERKKSEVSSAVGHSSNGFSFGEAILIQKLGLGHLTYFNTLYFHIPIYYASININIHSPVIPLFFWVILGLNSRNHAY
jgi:hypothetical protein